MTVTDDRDSERVHIGGFGAAVGAILAKLEDLRVDFRDAILNSEQEPDFDQTFSGAVAANDGSVTINLPRTITHIEFDFQVLLSGSTTPVYLFDGTPGSAYMSAVAAQIDGVGGAIACATNSDFKGRDYLSGTGVLTIYNPTAEQASFNLRIRNLDRTQGRQEST